MTIPLTQFGISRPEKIRWRYEGSTTDVLSSIKSKTLRKVLQRADELLKENGISYELKKLDKSSFMEWLKYYTTNMTALGYDVIASEEWFDDRTAKGFEIEGLFFSQAGKLVGTGIFTLQGTEKATFAFKASERLNLSKDDNSSIGAILDYFFLKIMAERGFEVISAGRSRNAYGVVNSFGYVDYKLRFGYQPEADPKSELVNEVPVNDDGMVLFYGIKDEKLALYSLQPKGVKKTFEVARFATPELPFIELEY